MCKVKRTEDVQAVLLRQEGACSGLAACEVGEVELEELNAAFLEDLGVLVGELLDGSGGARLGTRGHVDLCAMFCELAYELLPKTGVAASDNGDLYKAQLL